MLLNIHFIKYSFHNNFLMYLCGRHWLCYSCFDYFHFRVQIQIHQNQNHYSTKSMKLIFILCLNYYPKYFFLLSQNFPNLFEFIISLSLITKSFHCFINANFKISLGCRNLQNLSLIFIANSKMNSFLFSFSEIYLLMSFIWWILR